MSRQQTLFVTYICYVIVTFRGGLGPYGPGAMIVLQELVLICKAVTPELWVAEFGLQCTNMFSTIVVINMWSSDSRVLGASLQPSLLQEALLN